MLRSNLYSHYTIPSVALERRRAKFILC